VAIGYLAGQSSQKGKAVAVGYAAGQINQGNYSIAIGNYAGQTSQANNSIVLNAQSGASLDAPTTGFFVKPIRNAALSYYLRYDPTTGEISYA
jgi:hypothetical protein